MKSESPSSAKRESPPRHGLFTLHISHFTEFPHESQRKFPGPLSPERTGKAWSARGSSRVFGIMAEFVKATEKRGFEPSATWKPADFDDTLAFFSRAVLLKELVGLSPTSS